MIAARCRSVLTRTRVAPSKRSTSTASSAQFELHADRIAVAMTTDCFHEPFAEGGTVKPTLFYLLLLAATVAFAAPPTAIAENVVASSSIQAAVDAASPGDTVIVPPGRYHETVTIGKSGITIRGSRGSVLDASGFAVGIRAAAGPGGPGCPRRVRKLGRSGFPGKSWTPGLRHLARDVAWRWTPAQLAPGASAFACDFLTALLGGR
jgi:hypothetical protein